MKIPVQVHVQHPPPTLEVVDRLGRALRLVAASLFFVGLTVLVVATSLKAREPAGRP